jgi:hypothetical protein
MNFRVETGSRGLMAFANAFGAGARAAFGSQEGSDGGFQRSSPNRLPNSS